MCRGAGSRRRGAGPSAAGSSAAGSGGRLGAGVAKAFVGLGGVPMLGRAVDGLLAADRS
ncbi:2-C-methyl-D-erythritol 4-phosphate cytidylyltransferase, partial [Pseudonocardia sp. McavD-2-B]|nr:2-C-methyl-D-erythritol 4-phosphate cytidylyltransferase [Pseudonocardia sp. McavD-2-B]